MRDTRRERRLDRYETIRELHRQGKSKSQIARELGVSAWLVRRSVAAEQFPERIPKAQRPTILTPFEPLLHEHWLAGEQTTPALWRAIVAAGYTGSIHTVRHWVQRRRQEPAAHTHPAYRAKYIVEPEQVAARAAAQQRLPGARQLAILLLDDDAIAQASPRFGPREGILYHDRDEGCRGTRRTSWMPPVTVLLNIPDAGAIRLELHQSAEGAWGEPADCRNDHGGGPPPLVT